jgi:hypothetical protein
VCVQVTASKPTLRCRHGTWVEAGIWAKGRGTAFNTGDGFQVIGIVRLPRLSTVSAGISLPPISQFNAGNRRRLECAPQKCSDLPRVGLGQIGWSGVHANKED